MRTYSALGHVTLDLHRDGEHSTGGTVLYSGLTAKRLGWQPTITTAEARLHGFLPGHRRAYSSTTDDDTVYLTFGYIPSPMSIFEGVQKVFPGELLRTDAHGRTTRHPDVIADRPAGWEA